MRIPDAERPPDVLDADVRVGLPGEQLERAELQFQSDVRRMVPVGSFGGHGPPSLLRLLLRIDFIVKVLFSRGISAHC
ncbi:MAG: hypothetical protein K2Y42_14405 [Hyphomicrobium sp.]|uniref:hypothetical protein n=1 Tax=Hyphomicrobium sp. TaxID=82 RepID=UPI0025BB0335|nr:hypothetical protein [Hyphomicrobium sp.]MBX9863934.1 hypothetical protein [Hyphomicrobium sp.]